MAREKHPAKHLSTRTVSIPSGPFEMEAEQVVPPEPRAVVVCAGEGPESPYADGYAAVLQALHEAGFATLRLESSQRGGSMPPSEHTARQRYDVNRYVQRLLAATDWLENSELRRLPVAFVGADAGATAVLHAAAARQGHVQAVVVVDGGSELFARDLLERVEAPTLWITHEDRSLRDSMLHHLHCEHEQERVAGVHPLSEGSCAQTCAKLSDWLRKHTAPANGRAREAWQRTSEAHAAFSAQKD